MPPRRPRTSSHLTPPTLAPTSKRRGIGGDLSTTKRISFPAVDYGVPNDLGECFSRDVELLWQVGWEDFVKTYRKGGTLRT